MKDYAILVRGPTITYVAYATIPASSTGMTLAVQRFTLMLLAVAFAIVACRLPSRAMIASRIVVHNKGWKKRSIEAGENVAMMGVRQVGIWMDVHEMHLPNMVRHAKSLTGYKTSSNLPPLSLYCLFLIPPPRFLASILLPVVLLHLKQSIY